MVNAHTTLRGLATAAALAALALPLAAKVAPGDPFPPLAPAGLTGGSMPDTAGKVLFVDFWASWCAPCKASFPAYSRISSAYADRGLVVVAVSVDDSPELFSAFVAKMRPSFATLNDGQHKLVSLVEVPTMPTSYLIDRSGRVRFVHAGFHGAQTEDQLKKEIEGLLAEKAPMP